MMCVSMHDCNLFMFPYFCSQRRLRQLWSKHLVFWSTLPCGYVCKAVGAVGYVCNATLPDNRPFVKEGCVELYMCWVAGLCRGRVPKVPIAGSAEGLTPGVRETS
jgi:hypothetical protein